CKSQFLPILPGFSQHNGLIRGSNQHFSLLMPTLADVFGLDYAFVSGFLAARDQVCKTLTGTPRRAIIAPTTRTQTAPLW
ncbi:MAG TPA: hypothetical protein VM366_07965, partial [Anaerolineae bacterium]|nr:hypothetical protein [Anaerolineae bacterium]